MANINTITVGSTTYGIAESGYSISDVYSTTEREIGTWIDGKKVYQKTFTGNLPASSTVSLVPSSLVQNVTNVLDYKVAFKSAEVPSYVVGFVPERTSNASGASEHCKCTCNGFSITNTASAQNFRFDLTNSATRGYTYALTMIYTK